MSALVQENDQMEPNRTGSKAREAAQAGGGWQTRLAVAAIGVMSHGETQEKLQRSSLQYSQGNKGQAKQLQGNGVGRRSD